MDHQTRVLFIYGAGLLCLALTIPLSLFYSEIMVVTSILLTLFIGFIQIRSLLTTYRYGSTIYSSEMFIVSGIIMTMIVAFTFTGIIDWEYLGLSFPNVFTVLWGCNAVLALLGGILARVLIEK